MSSSLDKKKCRENSAGLPFREALFKYGDPALLKRFQQLKAAGVLVEGFRISAGHIKHVAMNGPLAEFLDVERELVRYFLKKLESGQLLATGHDSRRATDDATTIPQELWSSLDPNFKRSSASGCGFAFGGIRVRAGGNKTKRSRTETEARTRQILLSGNWKGVRKGELEEELKTELGENFQQSAFDETWKEHATQNLKDYRGRPKRETP